jgi:hypothetical protein
VDGGRRSSTDDRRMRRAERAHTPPDEQRSAATSWSGLVGALEQPAICTTVALCGSSATRPKESVQEKFANRDRTGSYLHQSLTEPRLLPLTAGVLGDWGSGKSSLMRIVRVELEAEDITDALGRYSSPRPAKVGLPLGQATARPQTSQIATSGYVSPSSLPMRSSAMRWASWWRPRRQARSR